LILYLTISLLIFNLINNIYLLKNTLRFYNNFLIS